MQPDSSLVAPEYESFQLQEDTSQYQSHMESTESPTNSIDAYIKNGYHCEDMSDSEYISDESLKDFIKKIDKQKKAKEKQKELKK